jgi:hypothetical protein
VPVVRNRIRWIYVPPLVHLAICLVAMIGYIVPSLQFLGILWTILAIADFPLSAVTIMLAWGHGALAAVWAVGAGTLWWYLLSLTAASLVGRIRSGGGK